MNREAYKQRLIEFNNTPKYQLEQDFLIQLLKPKKNERILDYGTGLGRLVYHLNEHHDTRCYGYDSHNLREKDDDFLFKNAYTFKFEKVIFMHSISHVEDIEARLVFLREEMLEPDAKIYVITPNRLWIENTSAPAGYVPDPTVIRHFNQADLIDLFQEAGYKVSLSGQFGKLSRTQNERIFLEATI